MKYRPITPSDVSAVAEFIRGLYAEDPSDEIVSDERIERTFTELASHPDKGTILVFEQEGQLVGYSILINFWSNEFGGNIVTVDEIYVAKTFRGRGIGRDFIRYLIAGRFGNAVALQLEVTSKNSRARKLYEDLGFKAHKNETLHLNLKT